MNHIGIDIGGSSVKAVRLGEPRASARVAHDASTRPAVADAVALAASRVGVAAGDAVGLCLPGLLDGGGLVAVSSNLPCLVGEDPAALAQAATGATVVRTLTDAAAWGIGVSRNEPAPGRLLVVAMGTGIGASLRVDGDPVTLDGVTPGHIGMIDVSLGEPDPPRAGDGTPGVLEAYAGGRALLARFGRDGIADGLASMDADDPAIRALARGLRICHAVYKPHAIRLVGGVGALLAPKITLLDAMVREGLCSVAQDRWTLAAIDDPFLAAEGAAASAKAGGDGSVL